MGLQEAEPRGTSGMPDGAGIAALSKVPLALVLTNPHLDDNPIVYANRAFEKITGYSADAVIGRNCRFLQGDRTDPDDSRRIGEALRDETDIAIDLVNYRADGTKFLNRLMITPLYDDTGSLQCFLGVQRDISEGSDAVVSSEAGREARSLDAALGEIQHRVKNHLAMIIGMIRMQSRVETSADSFNALARRIESLQLLYQEMTEAGVGSTSSRQIPLGAYVSRIAATIGHLDGRRSVRVNIDCDAIHVDVERAARIGLLFSEILTNALKHAFEGREEGLVDARLKMLSSGVIRMSVADDGIGLPPEAGWPYGSGAKPANIDETAVREAVEDTRRSAVASEPNIARQIADGMGQSRAPSELQDGDGSGDEPGSAVVDTSGNALRRRRAGEREGGLGGRIAASLVRGLDATIDVNSMTSGTTVTVDIPAGD